MAQDVPAYRPFRDLEAQLQQLTMNAWGAPQRILSAHAANEISNLARDWPPATATPTRLPCPEEAEAFAMPADHCCRLGDHQGAAPIRPEAGDQDPEPAIRWMQSWSGCLSVQHGQLLAHRHAFEIRGSQRSIKPMQKGYEEQGEHLSHGQEAIRPMAR